MDFLENWQEKIKHRIKRIADKPKAFIKNKTGLLLYCAVAAMAFQDAAQALAGGNLVGVSMALVILAGAVGGNLLANLLQKLVDKNEEQAAEIIKAEIKKSPDLRNAIDDVVDKLELLPAILAQLKADDREWMSKLMNDALRQAGSRLTISAKISAGKDSAISVQGPAIRTSDHGISVVDSPGTTITFTQDRRVDDTKIPIEQRYLNFVRHEHGHIKLFGFLSRANIDVSLLDVFVSLQFSDYARDMEFHRLQEGRERQPLTPPEVLERAVRRNRSLLILGGPGSGKTTLLKYYAVCCLDERQRDQIRLRKSYIPLLIPLRKIDPFKPFPEALSGWANEHNLKISPKLFDEWLHQPGALVMLDGLDEVSDLKTRQKVCQWIDAAVPVYGESTFIITCRFTGYREADGISLQIPLIRADVRELNTDQQRTFLRQWFQAALSESLENWELNDAQTQEQISTAADHETEEIMKFLLKKENRSLQDMAGIPVLLQIMAIIWREQGSLAGERVELYNRSIDYLLDHRDRAKKIEPLMSATKARLVLRPLALWMQASWQKDEAPQDKIQPILSTKLADVKPDITPEKFLENIRDRAGVLVGAGAETYTFQHKSFREFLSALEICNTKQIDLLIENFENDWWQETILFSAGMTSPEVFPDFIEWFLKSEKNLGATSPLLLQTVQEAATRPLAPFEKILRNKKLAWQKRYNTLHCLKIIGSEPAKKLAQIALNDPEPKVKHFAEQLLIEWQMLKAEAVKSVDERTGRLKSIFNPIEDNAEYIFIPGGSFTIVELNKPMTVKPFYLAKFPVTNKLYRKFFETSGREKPYYWNDKKYNQADQPVVGVSWHDAIAYCDWLTNNSLEGFKYRLPTEAEWEWAAGRGEREYPWGNEKPDHNRANYDNKVGQTTPVGSYPTGATPDGLMDMAGNVWEWCADWYDQEKKYRVLRGGAFVNSDGSLRCAIRGRDYPGDRVRYVGFRVVGGV